MDRALQRTLPLVVGVFLLAAVEAGADWVPLGDEAKTTPSVDLRAAGPHSLILELEVPGFWTRDVPVASQDHVQIVLPGQVSLQKEGWPALPVISRRLIIPYSGTPSLRILASEVKEVATLPVMPSKGDLPRSVDPAAIPYWFAPIYQQGGVFPDQVAELGTPFVVRDERGLGIFFYPVRYDATRQVLLVTRRLSVEITFAGDGGVNAKVPRSGVPRDPQFENLYARLFANPAPTKNAALAIPGPMLVICHDAFLGSIAPFVSWKRQKGIPVEVLSTSAVGGTALGIQSAINARYYAPPGLAYVVLVGDIAEVPTNQGTLEGASSDVMYGMVEGDDSYADIFVSRLSAQTASQVQTQVAKLVRYEKEPDPSGDWYHQAAGIASNQAGGTGLFDFERADLLRDALLGYTFSQVDQIYQGAGGSTEAITAALNQGRSLVNYIGHGSGSAWTSILFGVSQIHLLDNAGRNPWILDVSCSNGDFTLSECFAEAWLRAGTTVAPTGAVATFSSSTQASWVPPTVMQAEVVDQLVTESEQSLGALYFAGAMKVLDSYPPPGTEGLKLVEQYNIFGDCSLIVRTDTPADLAVNHAPFVLLMSPSLAIETAGIAGATAVVTRDGVIHGTGVTDMFGHAEIVFVEPVASPGELTLTVTAFNRVPYIANIAAMEPAAVTVSPASIPVSVSSPVTVTVTDSLQAPVAGLRVHISGFGVPTQVVATDVAGEAGFILRPLYGEQLSIGGHEPGESYDLFMTSLPVTGAAALPGPEISAGVPEIGLAGALAPLVTGTVTASLGADGLDFHLSGCGLDTTLSATGREVNVSVVPACLGTLTAVLARPGAQVFTRDIPVIMAQGTLSGSVTELDGITPVSGVRLRGFPAGADTSEALPLFEVSSGGDGSYSVEEPLPAGSYDLDLKKFGFADTRSTAALLVGDNDHDVLLPPAAIGQLSGTVTALASGLPLAAEIELFRPDTGGLFAETTSDPADGAFVITDLPYSGYRATVRSPGYRPVSMDLTVTAPLVSQDFALQATIADLLLLDDSLRGDRYHPAKLGPEGGMIAPAYREQGESAADAMIADLEILGYNITAQPSEEAVYTQWGAYDLLLVSCGSNTSPLEDENLRANLESFVSEGGHILVEGGEVAYAHATSSFGQNVLHVLSRTHDYSGALTVADPDHHVMKIPNLISGPIAVDYTGYGDADAVLPVASAAMPGSWSFYPSQASVVTYDPNPAPAGGQTVFLTCNYAAMAEDDRSALLQNAVVWLLTEEVGNGSVAGSVSLQGETDQTGILVQVFPNGGEALTDASGAFAFDGLHVGGYRIRATKFGWAPAETLITLADGEHMAGLELVLQPSGGTLLIVDDSGSIVYRPAKYSEKGSRLLAYGYLTEPAQSAAVIAVDLEYLGYVVMVEDVIESDPSNWLNYDLLIFASSDNPTPVANPGLRLALRDYVAAGGKLLIEGGELAYDHALGDPAFARSVLHVLSWTRDAAGLWAVADSNHAVAQIPNSLPGPLSFAYVGYGDADVVEPTSDAALAVAWASEPDQGGVVAFDPDPAPGGGQIVTFTFNYTALEAVSRASLLENAVLWLLASENGSAGVSGSVNLEGESDHGGILVEVIPGGGSQLTDASGAFAFSGLPAGQYRLIARKDGWAAVVVEITLAAGAQQEDLDLLLTPAALLEFAAEPELAIPDDQTGGVSDSLSVWLSAPTSAVEVYLDLTHTWIGDLRISLVSAAGTRLRLHNRSGAGGDLIRGWYPLDLEPAESLDALLGEDPAGTWRLHVSDHAEADTGVLHAWKLRFHYPGLVTAADDDALPRDLVLLGNQPNPFNPRTEISFAVPSRRHVELAIFDLAGRRVASLLREEVPPGLHAISWRGQDDRGRSVASGLYFARLRSGAKVLLHKMLLVR